MIGSLLYKFDRINSKDQKELLLNMFYHAKDFINTCENCENECIKNPGKNVSFQNMIENGLVISELPEKLQKQTSLNFFYIEFTNYMANLFESELNNIIDEELTKAISSYYYWSFLNFINDNCYEDCNNECISEHNKNAYCKFCMLGKKRLLCPKQGQIDYDIIKATPEDMQNH